MAKKRRTLLILITILCLIPVLSFANSAEPPGVIIIVPNAPEDMTMFLDGYDAGSVRYMDNEAQFAFYYEALSTRDVHEIQVRYGGTETSLTIDNRDQQYRKIYTYDFESGELKVGESLIRNIRLISYRLILTLIIEALIFALFKFRSKYHWTVFLIINLITQGYLNYWLNLSLPFESYIIIKLIWGEIFVFIGELFAFSTLIKDRKKWITIIYVLLANFLSLFAGILLLGYLPV